MAFKTFFENPVTPQAPKGEKPTLGSDPTAKPASAIPGTVKPKDLTDGKSLWHGPKGGK